MGLSPQVTSLSTLFSPVADGPVGPYETSLQIDYDQEEAGTPMGLVVTDEPVGSVGTFPSSDSGIHSFAEQWEDGSLFMAEAEGSCILTEDSSCSDYEPITVGPVGSAGMFSSCDTSICSLSRSTMTLIRCWRRPKRITLI